jgi:hypothetical protein
MLMRKPVSFPLFSDFCRGSSGVVPEGSALFYGHFLWVTYFFRQDTLSIWLFSCWRKCLEYTVSGTVASGSEYCFPDPFFSGGFQSFSRMETAGLLRKVHGFQPVSDRIWRPEASTWEPMARHVPTIRMTVVRAEILPTDRLSCNWNALKISAQRKVSCTRYWISIKDAYPTKVARVSGFLKIQYRLKETFLWAEIFRAF